MSRTSIVEVPRATKLRGGRRWQLGILVAVGTLAGQPIAPAATTDVVALTGQASPDGNGVLVSFSGVIDSSSRVTFDASLTATAGGNSDNSGVYAARNGQVTRLAREGQAAPGGGTFAGFDSSVVASDTGQIIFRSTLGGTNPPSGVFRHDGVSLSQVARTSQAVPGGDGSFLNFQQLALNDAGQIAFNAGLANTLGGTSNNFAVYRDTGTSLSQIARKGQTVPDGNGSFSSFDQLFVGDAGQVTFGARLSNTLGGSADDYGVFQGNGTVLVQIAREGQFAPDGNGKLLPNTPRSTNRSGQTVFRAQLTGTSLPGADDEGVYRGQGGPLTQIARSGQFAPDGNGKFSGFAEPVINDLGQAAFAGSFAGTAQSGVGTSGIFRGDGGSLTQIARADQPSPDANGVFQSFNEPSINNSGQIAFRSFLNSTAGGSTDNLGLYFYDDRLGLKQIARTRQSLLGRLIVDLQLGSQLLGYGSSMNDWGQVAFGFTLADGYKGIAVWSPTIPGDFNLDGAVDAADYVTWRKTGGSPSKIDVWRANYGRSALGSGLLVVSIPEPSALFLITISSVTAVVIGPSRRCRKGPVGTHALPR